MPTAQQKIDQIVQYGKDKGYSQEKIDKAVAKVELEVRKKLSERKREEEISPLAKVSGFVSDNIFAPLGTVTQTIGAGINRHAYGKYGKENSESHKKSQELIQQAKQTNDPEEKKRLLLESRRVMHEADSKSNLLYKTLDNTQRMSGISDDELSMNRWEFAGRQGVAQTADLASIAVGAKAPMAGANVFAKTGSKALATTTKYGVNAASAGLGAVAYEAQEQDNFVEGASSVGNAMILSGLFDGFVDGASFLGKQSKKGFLSGLKLVKDKAKKSSGASADDTLEMIQTTVSTAERYRKLYSMYDDDLRGVATRLDELGLNTDTILNNAQPDKYGRVFSQGEYKTGTMINKIYDETIDPVLKKTKAMVDGNEVIDTLKARQSYLKQTGADIDLSDVIEEAKKTYGGKKISMEDAMLFKKQYMKDINTASGTIKKSKKVQRSVEGGFAMMDAIRRSLPDNERKIIDQAMKEVTELYTYKNLFEIAHRKAKLIPPSQLSNRVDKEKLIGGVLGVLSGAGLASSSGLEGNNFWFGGSIGTYGLFSIAKAITGNKSIYKKFYKDPSLNKAAKEVIEEGMSQLQKESVKNGFFRSLVGKTTAANNQNEQ